MHALQFSEEIRCEHTVVADDIWSVEERFDGWRQAFCESPTFGLIRRRMQTLDDFVKRDETQPPWLAHRTAVQVIVNQHFAPSRQDESADGVWKRAVLQPQRNLAVCLAASELGCFAAFQSTQIGVSLKRSFFVVVEKIIKPVESEFECVWFLIADLHQTVDDIFHRTHC